MVNLLRFVEKDISSNWFVVFKPFGIPTTTTSKTSWDLNKDDSVLNRIHLMGYEEAVNRMYEQKSPCLKGTSLASVKQKNYAPFAPLWNMASDSRGLLAACRGKKAIEFFLTASKCKLIQRSYIVLTETGNTVGTPKASINLPEVLEGYTLRSDQFWSPMGQSPRYEERIYMLFISDQVKNRRDHPWLSSNQRLTVIPSHKVGQHYGKRFHMRTKLLYSKNTSQGSNKEKVRQMYRVDLIEGTEEGLRCVLAHFGFPIVNDAIYNSAFASEVFQKYKEGHFSRTFPSVHTSIERGLLELALRPLESQFIHLGMSCCKVTLPDPDDEANIQQVDRAKLIMDAGSSKDSLLFTENLNSITIESEILPEFTAWVNGEPIPGVSAKNATMPIENFSCLAKKLLHPNSLNKVSFEGGEEDTIMVTDGLQKRQLAQYTPKSRVLKHRLVQCTPPVDTMKRDPFKHRLPNTQRGGLLCKNCGDFHSEHSCPLVPTSQLGAAEGYVEFYEQSTGQSVRKPFCITCGVFGHSFRTCVHSYARYHVHQNSTANTSEFSRSFARKIRQCQICKDSSHIELHCARKKSPPWGFDELGQPITRNVDTTGKRRWGEING
ncbi:hypothetical protein XU18_0222 [Perkinsela sp. CCAP 1560/4]|nr:hypothetical protein XU18_0222 [Perkinsela sp. CCAP 1560/4]|eukprot:KNH09537.1 hypothetical protein XU18_0222 [Perkinsela sp. CCAP 1560/4]